MENVRIEISGWVDNHANAAQVSAATQAFKAQLEALGVKFFPAHPRGQPEAQTDAAASNPSTAVVHFSAGRKKPRQMSRAAGDAPDMVNGREVFGTTIEPHFLHQDLLVPENSLGVKDHAALM